MSLKLSSYQIPPPIRSSLLKNAPESVPTVGELEQLCEELEVLQKKTLERAKKAGEDLKTIHESMRQIKEREKGKSKVVDKVKRERDFTPLPDADEPRFSSSIHSNSSKPRLSSHPIPSLPPSSARSSLDPRRSAVDDIKKKKKKRKRENEDSDDSRPRKSTPPVNHTVTHPLSAKIQKPTIISTPSHSKSQTGPDFSLPASQPLLPQRPPIPPPPIPGPSKPVEVVEDFSKAKQPAQTLVTTFYSSIEPWIRSVREEDVGFLEYTGDEVEPYVMPKLGRHYLEVWEDQDAGLLAPVLLGEQEVPQESLLVPPQPKWDPSTLMEVDLLGEEKGHGPLTDRVISALLPIPDMVAWKGVKAAEDAMEGRPGGSGAAAARKERLNVSDLEVRIRDTMRFHGLLDSIPDYTEKVDDPIATALRHAQRELRTVVATNKARKERLAAIARDRLGYQEYLELRDSIDKNIANIYSKLQKKDVPKLAKKKKKSSGTAADLEAMPAQPLPSPAAIGLGPDEENKLMVSDQLRHLVETRRQWVDTVGSVFEEKQRDDPGRIWGLPKQSVYQGIDEEVQAILSPLQTGSASQVDSGALRTTKGKQRLNEDDMDVDP